MIKTVLCFSFLVSLSGFAATTIPLNSIGVGNLLHIGGSIELPKNHQLNKGAPSKIDVYEKDAKEWTLTEKINLNEFSA